MKAMTISDGFREAIAGRNVLRAFFTAYSFEPDFFELEVLPLLLGNPALSANETIRYYQLQNLMRHDQGRWAVAYDVDVFDPQLAPRLEVDYLPVRVGGACQHTKLAILLMEDKKTNVRSLILSAGSFNLTKAGWWENIEVGHWIDLQPGYAPRNIVKPLVKALNYFGNYSQSKAISELLDFIGALETTNDEPNCIFYFSGVASDRVEFSDFIQGNTQNRGALEIVTPFFSEQANNKTVTDFLSLFSQATVLLPIDEQGCALVDEKTVYNALSGSKVHWGQWRSQWLNSHVKTTDKLYRRLHAKIYQTPGEDGWCFVGSVNLSFKAFKQNVEAGFLLKGQNCPSLLDLLDTQPQHFLVEEETANNASADDCESMPAVQLIYDWQDDKLLAISKASGFLKLLNSESKPIAKFELKVDQEASISLPTLREQLGRSSLVYAEWQSNENSACVRRTLLVCQRNLFCRPSSLPVLDLSALLRIFQGLHESERLEIMATLAANMIRLNQESAIIDENLPDISSDHVMESFFSEFSQVNGAFWVLADRLKKAEQKNDMQTLRYFLKGCQPDSLSKVVDSVQLKQAGNTPSLIVRYLTLLSVDELLKRYQCHADQGLVKKVKDAISQLEQKELLNQLQMNDKVRFLNWFKKKFFQSIEDITRNKKSVE